MKSKEYIHSKGSFLKLLKYFIIVFFFAYFTSVTVCGELYPWNYLAYVFIILLTICVFLYFSLKKQFYFDSRFLPYLLFALYAILISLIMQSTDFRNLLTFIMLSFSLILCYYSCKIIGDKKILFFIFAATSLIYAIVFFSIYFKEFISFQFISQRLGGKLGNENTAGIISIIFLSFYSIISVKQKKFWLLVFDLPFLLIGISSGSKKFYFSFILLMLFILYILLKRHLVIYALCIFCMIFLSFAILQLPFMSSIRDRIYAMILFMFTGEIDASSYERLLFSKNAFYLFSKNIFFGLGEGGFGNNTIYGTYSHNNITEVACNFGLVGFVLFYVQMLTPLYLAKRNRNSSLYTYFVFIFLFYLIIGPGLIFYTSKYIPIFLAIVISIDGEKIISLRMKVNI